MSNTCIPTAPLRTKILIVDDDKFNVKVAELILQKMDVDYRLTFHANDAFELLRNEAVDLILMDLNMPEISGKQAASYIRSTLKLDTPIYALTAHSKDDAYEECIAIGMNGFLQKPYNRQDIQRLIEELNKEK